MATFPLDDDGTIGQVLGYLGNELDPSILIGGWATVAILGDGEISHDIDVILGDPRIKSRLDNAVQGLSTSTHVGASEIRGTVEGIHVDIYTPHESQLGQVLKLRVERLTPYSEPLPGTNWRLLNIEAHTMTKMAALLDRHDTEKGRKDAREIVRLLAQGVDANAACKILAEATAGPAERVPEHVGRVFDLLPTRADLNKAGKKQFHSLSLVWDSAAVLAIAGESQRPDFA